MTVLIDSHTLLWWTHEPERLTRAAFLAMEGADLLFGLGSVWELAIKANSGKLKFDISFPSWLAREMDRNGITLLSMSSAHVMRAAALPLHHRDPFDRLLVAQAQVEGLAVVTGDSAFGRYDVEVIW